ncbi:predicted protein [Enterococcus casseliflavus EC30]|nr:predicted protein [Enterococcus casseliflavus EC30]EEV34723.1 predicted protein [Enterococcus casseliflavus EC10]
MVRRQKGARQRGLAGRSKNEKVLGLFVGIQISYRENMKNFRVKFRNCVNLLINYGFCLNFFLKRELTKGTSFDNFNETKCKRDEKESRITGVV